MKLYDCQPAPNPRRVRIFIAEKGLEIPTEQVDLPKAQHLTPEFQKINPMCDVPVLELDDGTCISQVDGICRYLEAVYPDSPLYGRDAKEQGLVAMWNNYAAMQGMMSFGDAFRNSADMFKSRASLGPRNYEQIPALAERGKSRTKDFIDDMNTFLADKEYVAGDIFSIADITTAVTVDLAKMIGIDTTADHPNLQRWYNTVSARPSMTA